MLDDDAGGRQGGRESHDRSLASSRCEGDDRNEGRHLGTAAAGAEEQSDVGTELGKIANGGSEIRLNSPSDYGGENYLSEPHVNPPTVIDEISGSARSLTAEHLADDELLGALAASLYEPANIDHTLDVLTSSIDLFEVPAWDSDSSS